MTFKDLIFSWKSSKSWFYVLISTHVLNGGCGLRRTIPSKFLNNGRPLYSLAYHCTFYLISITQCFHLSMRLCTRHFRASLEPGVCFDVLEYTFCVVFLNDCVFQNHSVASGDCCYVLTGFLVAWSWGYSHCQDRLQPDIIHFNIIPLRCTVFYSILL